MPRYLLACTALMWLLTSCGAGVEEDGLPEGDAGIAAEVDSGLPFPPPDGGDLLDAGGPSDAGPAGDGGLPPGRPDPDAGKPPGRPDPDAGPIEPTDAGPPRCTTDGWSDFARPLLEANCLRCHAWAAREADVRAKRVAIRSRVASGSMPRGGSLVPQERDRLLLWLDCGAP